MNSVILTKSPNMPFHTLLKSLLEGLGDTADLYQWLLTDYSFKRDDVKGLKSDPEILLTADDLRKLSAENPNLQIVWGVLSAFPKDLILDVHDLDGYPVAESGNTFWQIMPTLQHPGAVAEIVCFDSTYTVLLSKDQNLMNNFMSRFPEAESLPKFNRNLKNSEGIKD